MNTLSVGSKCALMLPKKFINLQLTPAKGMIINELIGSEMLVLIEEVWQFKGFPKAVLSEMCFPTGKIKSVNWGWQEIPNIVKEDEYLVLPARRDSLMLLRQDIIDAMIKESVEDFKKVNNFI